MPRPRRNNSSNAHSRAVSSTGLPSIRARLAAPSTTRPPSNDARRQRRLRTAQQRAHARLELRQRERFRQVVVGAEVEAVDALVDRFARRQHQHGRRSAACAKRRSTSKPSMSGRPMSSNSRSIAVPLQRGIRVLAAARVIDAIFLLLQGSDEAFERAAGSSSTTSMRKGRPFRRDHNAGRPTKRRRFVSPPPRLPAAPRAVRGGSGTRWGKAPSELVVHADRDSLAALPPAKQCGPLLIMVRS